MVPAEVLDAIPDIFISVTENGVQNHESLLAAYKHLETILQERGMQKPLSLLTDGHSSRFDFSVLA